MVVSAAQQFGVSTRSEHDTGLILPPIFSHLVQVSHVVVKVRNETKSCDLKRASFASCLLSQLFIIVDQTNLPGELFVSFPSPAQPSLSLMAAAALKLNLRSGEPFW